jgi:Protein of unknown function (DUF760)
MICRGITMISRVLSNLPRGQLRMTNSLRHTLLGVVTLLIFSLVHSFLADRNNGQIPFMTNTIRSSIHQYYHTSAIVDPFEFRITQSRFLKVNEKILITTRLPMIGGGDIMFIVTNDGDDENGDDNDEEEDDEQSIQDPYMEFASSEFEDSDVNTKLSSSTGLSLSPSTSNPLSPSTSIDWGGALGTLRKRVDDVEQGLSGNPSQALFRLMSAQSPNQMIGNFVEQASPQVVQAMSGAVDSLLGGLSNPATGIETIVKATGDKIGSLCFQLQMTG